MTTWHTPAAPAWSLACVLEDRFQLCTFSFPPHAPSPPPPAALWRWTASSSGRRMLTHVDLMIRCTTESISHNALTFRWCLRLKVIFFLKDLRQHQSVSTNGRMKDRMCKQGEFIQFHLSCWLILVDWLCCNTNQNPGVDHGMLILAITKHIHQPFISWKPIRNGLITAFFLHQHSKMSGIVASGVKRRS